MVAGLPRPFRAALVRTLRRWTPYELFIHLSRMIPIGSMSPRESLSGPQRIAYVLPRYPELTETFIRREAAALRAAGIDLHVFAREPGVGNRAEDPNSPAGTVTYYGPRDAERARNAMRRFFLRKPLRVTALWLLIVRREDVQERTLWRDREILLEAADLARLLAAADVNHVHSPWAFMHALTAFVAARMIGATFSVQARASDVNRTVNRVGLLDRISRSDFIVTNSRFMESRLREIAGARRSPPVHVNPNGVDIERFHPPVRTVPAGSPVRIVAVGRLIEAKGFRYLLLACEILRRRGHAFSCEIIGGPEPGDVVTAIELRRLLEDRNLSDTVTFAGAAGFSSVLSALERADVFALPCVVGPDGTQDVTPNALIEAMAMALPVVSTPTGAIPEIVDSGTNGILVPPRDEVALADALERLITDPMLREKFGTAAREKVVTAFDSARNARRLIELFADPTLAKNVRPS